MRPPSRGRSFSRGPVCNWGVKLPAVVAVALVLGACSEQFRPSDVYVMPTPIEFVNGGECPPAPSDLGDDAGCFSQVGTARETVAVYALVGPDSRPLKWRIRYESDETRIDQPLKAGNPFSYPRAIGPIDVEGDGSREWLIKTVDLASHGTNWQRLQLFIIDGNRLSPLRYESEPLSINVGGTSRMGEGGRCDDGRFVLLRTEAEDRQNTIWWYSERVLQIDGFEATLITRREGELRLSDYNDPDLDPYYSVECGDFVYP